MKKSENKTRKKTLPKVDLEKDFLNIMEHLKEENRYRSFPTSNSDSEKIDLLSNDYLGLGKDAYKYMAEFRERFPDATFTSSASRLLSRSSKYHLQLENYLEDIYGKPALLLNSGYHANVGIIQALALPGTLFLADKLVHASAIDGLRLSGADFKRFPHNNLKKLRQIIKTSYDEYDRIIIIAEAIYSMDGDVAPIRELVKIKEDFPKVMLYLDEAHSFGVRGEKGLGLAEETGLIDKIDIIIGTLGKAAASAGAFAVTSQVIKDFLINTARSLIFSTAISPAQVAWSILMIEKLTQMTKEREYLRNLSKEFIKQLASRINVETISHTHIVPIIIGDAGEALNMAKYLSDNGFDTLAIRKPTVPVGSERLRLSLNAKLTKKDITRLVGLIGNYH